MKPGVSINIAVHYDFFFLEECLKSIVIQERDDFEILLIVDIDPQGMNLTEKEKAEKGLSVFNGIIENIEKINNGKVQIRSFFIAPCSIGVARQKGVEFSSGDIVVFIDPDCILPDEKWLGRIISPFNDPDISVVWTLGAFHRNDPVIMRYSILSNPYHEKMVPGTGHTAIRKSAIIQAGGFHDLPGGEDKDLINRLSGKFIYMPNLGVYHYHALTLSKFLWKHYRNARKAPLIKIEAEPAPKDLFSWIFKSKEDPAWLLHPFIVPLKLAIIIVARAVRKIKG